MFEVGFLTTFANAVVKPIHEQAMPVILRTAKEIDVWMNAPADEAFLPRSKSRGTAATVISVNLWTCLKLEQGAPWTNSS